VNADIDQRTTTGLLWIEINRGPCPILRAALFRFNACNFTHHSLFYQALRQHCVGPKSPVVTDTQFCSGPLCGFNHRAALTNVTRHWLLAKHMNPVRQKFAGNRRVLSIRERHNRQINTPK
jgi:hypothetical protein